MRVKTSKSKGYYHTQTALKPSLAAAMRLFFPQKMKISRDIVESVIDVGSGFFLAVIIQLTIFPLFDLHPTILDSMGIAIIFTIVSMTRSALWRRFFRKRKK